MKNLWGREPSLILGLIQAVLALLLAFSVDISQEQMGAILAVSAAILAVITRQTVTPTKGSK